MAVEAGQTGSAYVSSPTSIGIANPRTLAHELGHSMSLRHAPCGFLFDADPTIRTRTAPSACRL